LLQQVQQEVWGASRSLRAVVSLQGHLSESNWETVVVAMSVRVIAMVVGRGHADSSDETWSVSELISFLTLAITIFQFVFQHHTAWLLVSLGINVPKSEKQVRVSVFFA